MCTFLVRGQCDRYSTTPAVSVMELDTTSFKPCKRLLPRVQSCPALVMQDRVRPASDPADAPAPKVLRTCFSMSNLQAADVHHQNSDQNQSSHVYSVVARNENGQSKVFNFSPTDTIQDMIETMGKSTRKTTMLRSSGSCHSISEDAVYSEGLLFEPGRGQQASANDLQVVVEPPVAAPAAAPVHRLVEAVNDSTVPLSEDTMRSYLHPNLKIQEPRGVYSGLCACVAFLKDIFEANGRPYVVLNENSRAPGDPQDSASGTLSVDVTYSPKTVESSVTYKSMHGMLAYLEFHQDPREICGYDNPESAVTGENCGVASLEDPWTLDTGDLGFVQDVPTPESSAQGDIFMPAMAATIPAYIEPSTEMFVPPNSKGMHRSLSTEEILSQKVQQESNYVQTTDIPSELPEGLSLAEIFDSSEFTELMSEDNPDYWMMNVPAALDQQPNSTVPEEHLSGNLAVRDIKREQLQEPSVPAPAPQESLSKQPVHREGYMRSKAHEAKGLEQDYQCGYCHHIRTSASACSDGRVRIRCACGGKHRDGNPRMHAFWKPVKGHIIRKNDSSDNLSVASGATDASLAGATEAMSLKSRRSRSGSG